MAQWLKKKKFTCQGRRLRSLGFSPWIWKIPWRRKWKPTPVFLPGKFHGQGSLAEYSPWGHKESDMTATEHTAQRLVNIAMGHLKINILRCLSQKKFHFPLEDLPGQLQTLWFYSRVSYQFPCLSSPGPPSLGLFLSLTPLGRICPWKFLPVAHHHCRKEVFLRLKCNQVINAPL